MFRVYVGNLPYRVRDKELREYFEQVGAVKDAIVPLNGDRRSMGFGFVEFETEEAFQKALGMNGTDMEGRPLRIDAARPKPDRNGGSDASRQDDRATDAPDEEAPVAESVEEASVEAGSDEAEDEMDEEDSEESEDSEEDASDEASDEETK